MASVKSFDELSKLISLSPAKAIMNLMDDGKERTFTDFVIELEETFRNHDVITMQHAVNRLVHEGDLHDIKEHGSLTKYVKIFRKETSIDASAQVVASTISPPALIEMPDCDRPAIHPSDKKPMMIWKVMSDYKPWSVKKLSVLLKDFNFGASTISVNMAHLNKLGWFDRDGTLYILKKEIPCPDRKFSIYSTKTDEVSAKKESAMSTAVTPTNAASDDSQPTVETTKSAEEAIRKERNEPSTGDATINTPSEVTTVITKTESPKVRWEDLQDNSRSLSETPLIAIYLKGVKFTVSELTTLVDELDLLLDRFQYGIRPTMIQCETTFTIKGISFTQEELETIKSEFYKE